MTATASDLRVSRTAVSKHLGNLVAHIGARLIERNPRAMRPTAQGMALYKAAEGALAAIDVAIEGDKLPRRRNPRKPSPTRADLYWGAAFAPHRGEFQDNHPAVAVEAILENRSVDLIHENVDLALRMGRPIEQDVSRLIPFQRWP